MKLNGEKAGVYETTVVFPRDGKMIVFKLRAVDDPAEYAKIAPRPTVPTKTIPGGKVVPHFEDKSYKKALSAWIDNQYAWIYIKTLTPTEGLEWEKVKLEDPSTYALWSEELTEFGLATVELNHLFQKIQEVNALSDSKLEEARERFLLESLSEQEP